MTPEAQRIAIAEACGWKEGTTGLWQDPAKSGYYACPDYLNDLNAMHEAEKAMTTAQHLHYLAHLGTVCLHSGVAKECATAAQRAEAFLKTLGLWKN